MKTINRSALVPYTAQQMYNLVQDIAAYPIFLPWCTHASEYARTSDSVYACIDVSKGRFQQSFSTHNQYIDGREISMHLEEGPFNHLEGRWHFSDIDDKGSQVSLYLQFDFSTTVAKITIGPVFNVIADRLIDAFIERARVLYG